MFAKGTRCLVRTNSTWDEDYKSGEESWAQAEIVKAHFRAPFEALMADEEDENLGSDQSRARLGRRKSPSDLHQ